jgi:DNA-binding transcriptional ArsR family regulator
MAKVNFMVNSHARLQATFGALADPVRRSVIEQLARGEAAVSSLAAGHAMSLPGFLKHLRVLEQAALVTTRKEGRVRTCRLQASSLADAEEWLSKHRIFWQRQLDSLERFLSTPDPKESKK